MPAGLLYLDSSALVKLVLPEAETPALVASVRDWPQRASSVLAEVEVPRAIARATADRRAVRRAREVLASLYLVELDAEIRAAAAGLQPARLRALDALYLACEG